MTQPQRSGGWSLRGPELFGVLLIVVGVVYFLGNANIVHISWNLVWPVLVIGLGAVVIISALRPHAAPAGALAIPRDGTDQLELDLAMGAGEFRVGGGAAQLLDVTSNRDDITSTVDRSGSRSRVRLRQDPSWFPFGGRMYARWDVKLANDVPTAINLQGGAGSFEVDLSAVRVVDARLTFGAAQARVTLPQPTGEVAITISSGAASITITIPGGVEARVRGSNGLLQVDGRTETPGYATARDRVDVSLTGGGASTIRVI